MVLTFLKCVFLLLFLFIRSESKLVITFPQELAKKFEKGRKTFESHTNLRKDLNMEF